MDLRQSAVRLQTGIRALSNSRLATPALCGTLIGLLLASTALAWTLTWSDDRSFTCAAILMLAFGVMIGNRKPLSQWWGLTELAVANCTWTLLIPWVLSGSTLFLRYVPLTILSDELSRLLIGMLCAAPVWLISGWLWSGLVAGAMKHKAFQSRNRELSGLAIGFAVGLLGTGCLSGPWLGTWTLVASAVVIVIGIRLIVGSNTTESQFVESPCESSTAITSVELIAGGISATALGCLLAVMIRMLGQLVPDGSQVVFLEWAALAIGLALGLRFSQSMRADWFMLLPAAGGALFIAILPLAVGILLWANSSLASVTLVLAVRAIILGVAMLPIGFAAGGLIHDTESTVGRSFRDWPAALIAFGFVIAQFSFDAIRPVDMLTASSLALVLPGLAALTGRFPAFQFDSRPSWRAMTALSGCALMGLSVPLWKHNDNPAQTAKLLFSTPSFLAHRAGWDIRLLPMLDDARAIDVREGLRGPLTLWRSHGLQLQLRENGIPRAGFSASTDVHPQLAPEVLQVVFPMLLAREPRDVLLLGASAGLPLATCLQFPIQEVTCAENDRQLIQIIRGPITDETLFDPFADERVHWTATPPVLALMARPRTFDVILSSPPSSSIVAGGAMFTVDYYQNASGCLSAGGVFCQRFECLDYGPGPLGTIVQSMQQAFRRVMAIETAAGEMLLLGTNLDEPIVPADLLARLESPHVRRVLAGCGLDWSTLLNLPAYDPAALSEICARSRANSPANGLLALRAPLELMRWGPKLLEVQSVLTALRTTPASYRTEDPANPDGIEKHVSRKSRILEWLGEDMVTADLLRRLSEVATQYKLVQEFPDSHWWAYRRELRQQLQNRPRSTVQQVGHSDQGVHPEDQRRRDYFVALSDAARDPSAEHIDDITGLLQPYDPLMTYFARQEIADLQDRGSIDPAAELANRLHVIYFAPTVDASTRNVATAIELLVRNPETIPAADRRFDVLNGLVQTLRNRWEVRQVQTLKTPKRQITDVDRSVVAVDKAVQAMDSLYREAGLSDADWKARKQVIDRVLLRPLHTYRGQLQTSAKRSEGQTQAAIREATDEPHESK